MVCKVLGYLRQVCVPSEFVLESITESYSSMEEAVQTSNTVHVFRECNSVRIYHNEQNTLHPHSTSDSFFSTYSPFLKTKKWMLLVDPSLVNPA